MSSASTDARAALLADLFSEKPMARAFGHEVYPGLFLANAHALSESGGGWQWLRAVARADAVVVVAAELADAARALPASLRPLHVGMEEADARACAAGAGAAGDGGAALLPLGVTRAYAAALRAQLEAAADAAAAHLRDGRRVVVACKYGANRSASAVLALLARHERVPLLDGLQRLRAARPKVYPNIETWTSLLAIEAAAAAAGALPAGAAPSVSEEELLRWHTWSPRNLAAAAAEKAAAAAKADAVAAAAAADAATAAAATS
jgi:hypothetical protein